MSPRGVDTRACTPSIPRSTTAVAPTSASLSIPNVTTRPRNHAALATMRSSSAFATSTEAAVAPSRISAFALAIPSTESKEPRWASPTLVQTRISGWAMLTSVPISPAWLIPSSTTAISGRVVNSISDSGNPMWLFRFPRLRTTRYLAARNSAVISFVVVFPALPVMATTLVPDSIRTACASAWSAAVVSSTSMTTAGVPPARERPRRRGRTSPAAPASIAACAKSAPSRRSPRMPMYNSPGASVRVSIDTPVNWRVSAPATIAPAMAVATQSAFSRISGVSATARSLHHARVGPSADQRVARHGDIVERQRAVADHLILLVSFAHDEHQVAGPRELDRFSNRRQAIDDR